MHKTIAAAALAAAVAAPVALGSSPAYAGTCSTYGCGGQVYNSAPDYGTGALTLRVTYTWSDTDSSRMAYWDKHVQPQMDALCLYKDGELRCDVDGVFTPAGYNVFCYDQAGNLDAKFVDTGWHKIGNWTDYDCRRYTQ